MICQPPTTRSSVALIGIVTGSASYIMLANARTIVDLAVPRLPLSRTSPNAWRNIGQFQR